MNESSVMSYLGVRNAAASQYPSGLLYSEKACVYAPKNAHRRGTTEGRSISCCLHRSSRV